MSAKNPFLYFDLRKLEKGKNIKALFYNVQVYIRFWFCLIYNQIVKITLFGCKI